MTQTVLLVDDEPNVLLSLQRTLHREPFQVLTAESAAAAMDLMDRTQVDVIVSDDEMPDISGVDLLAQLRILHPGTVRLLLTGRASVDRTVQAINEAHIFRFLSKPCPPVTLIEAMHHAFEHKRLMDRGAEAIQLLRQLSGVLRSLAAHDPQAFTEASRSAGSLRVDSDDFASSSFIADELEVQIRTISSLHPALVLRPQG